MAAETEAEADGALSFSIDTDGCVVSMREWRRESDADADDDEDAAAARGVAVVADLELCVELELEGVPVVEAALCGVFGIRCVRAELQIRAFVLR